MNPPSENCEECASIGEATTQTLKDWQKNRDNLQGAN